MHIVDPPLAADDDPHPRGEGRGSVQDAVDLARRGRGQFEAAIDQIRGAEGFGRPRIGCIGVAETALARLAEIGQGAAAAKPRSISVSSTSALCRRLVSAVPAQPPSSRSGQWPGRDGGAHRLEGVAVGAGEVEQETFAGLAQRVDRMVHLQRRFRRQPGSERQDALRPRACGGITSAISPLIWGRLSPAAHEIRICGSANDSARELSASVCSPWISARSRASLLVARTRVRINRNAATTVKPSSASAVASTANS